MNDGARETKHPANPVLDRLEQAYRDWATSKGGSYEEVIGLFADRAEMQSLLPPQLSMPIGGTHASKAQIREYFVSLLHDWEMLGFHTYRITPAGDQILVEGHCHWRHRATGGEVSSPKIDLWRFEGGKAVRFFEMFDTYSFARAAGLIEAPREQKGAGG